jgi:cytochrome d ubiquinol oxidase subunit II
MAELWSSALALMLTGFVIFGGADFGVGALSLFLAKTDAERRAAIAAIGPFWHGNEVWLIASGGVLFLAFPTLLATAFPAFYLAFFLVLWCLVLRGVSLEVRSHVEDALWRAFWDVVFALSSGLLGLLFGVALGNVIRGVPIGLDRHFTLALFTNFSPVGAVGLLDYYTLSVGLFALVALLAHGAAFLAFRCDGTLRARARQSERRLWFVGAALFVVVSIETATLRPELFAALAARPLAWLASLVAVAGAVLAGRAHLRDRDGLVFLGSAALVGGLLVATAVALYPTLLRSTLAPEASLSAETTLSGRYGLGVALFWWPVAFVLAVSYFTFMFKKHAGKIRTGSSGPA